MSETLKIISPVDGSLYAERPTVGDGAVEAAFKAARAAQRDWRRLSVEERGRYCSAMVDAMLAMSAEIVPELAWQMGRPVPP